MAARVVLLRGINVGPNKRIAMPALREALTDAGFEDVRTYVQSGNVVLSSDAAPGVTKSDQMVSPMEFFNSTDRKPA